MKKRILSLLTIAFLISLIIVPLIIARLVYEAHKKELVKVEQPDTSSWLTTNGTPENDR